MMIVYGADRCEDTRRSLRHLRRLGVAHHYRNLDDDALARDRARALSADAAAGRPTPVVDLGVGGAALVKPDNDTLTAALVELQMLTSEDALELLTVQNVGDLERIARTAGGILLLASSGAATTPGARWLLRLAGGIVTLSGLTGWCPAFHYAGVTSLGGPCDRPDETTRRRWVVRTDTAAVVPGAGSSRLAANAGAAVTELQTTEAR